MSNSISGMTGFGRADGALDGWTWTVEARSVNGRSLETLWAARSPATVVATPEEAVILASIVEKETGIASERPEVAAVFTNRLRLGMRLESDPTIVYGVTKGRPLGRGILLSELRNPTPWNTYLIDGVGLRSSDSRMPRPSGRPLVTP